MPGPTETEFFERADMLDTKVGAGEKDDPADVARDGFEAMMAGKERVVVALVEDQGARRAPGLSCPTASRRRCTARWPSPGRLRRAERSPRGGMEAVAVLEDVRAFQTRGGNARYVARDADGRQYTTFREAIGERTKGRLEGSRVRITSHAEQRGDYTEVNSASSSRCRSARARATPMTPDEDRTAGGGLSEAEATVGRAGRRGHRGEPHPSGE